MIGSELSYEAIVDTSERMAWKISDILPPAATLDFRRKFLPDSLAGIDGISCLSALAKLKLNHIRAHAYLNFFAFVEEHVIAIATQHAGAELRGDQAALRAFLRFAEEEVKHQTMFRRFAELLEASFGHRCEVLASPTAVAGAMLGRGPLAVLLVTLHLELTTQHHFVESYRATGEHEVDGLFSNMLRHHWMEEAQHAKIDQLEIGRLSSGLSIEQIERAVDEYIDILKELDVLLGEQARMDTDTLGRVMGRPFDDVERAEILAAQIASYRRCFVGLGVHSPAMEETLRQLSPTARHRVLEFARAISV